MAEKLTLSLRADTLARVRAAAAEEGLTVGAWLDRAARREVLRQAARRHEEWLTANPDVRAELDGFDRLAEKLETGWNDLSDAA